MWGEPHEPIRERSGRRTIPTRVGRTCHKLASSFGIPDHPHACGENECVYAGCFSVFGPSPRVWGERSSNVPPPEAVRTIPTRVGRTKHTVGDSQHLADHPHACGENRHRISPCIKWSGPSPRVWGEHLLLMGVRTVFRTIPTRVGRTIPWCGSGARGSDHPHACGENHT